MKEGKKHQSEKKSFISIAMELNFMLLLPFVWLLLLLLHFYVLLYILSSATMYGLLSFWSFAIFVLPGIFHISLFTEKLPHLHLHALLHALRFIHEIAFQTRCMDMNVCCCCDCLSSKSFQMHLVFNFFSSSFSLALCTKNQLRYFIPQS